MRAKRNAQRAVGEAVLVPETLSSFEALARRAVALDGADAAARSLLGRALRRRGDYEGALAEAEQALATAPNLADAVLYFEGLFRHFENRRQLAGYAGLAPSPWKSGSIDQEQGISKAGNPRLRTTMVELAWMWVRYQPDSALSCWFRQRVGSERGRVRRISIVALARKLLIALSRYINHGEIPAGAVVKPD